MAVKVQAPGAQLVSQADAGSVTSQRRLTRDVVTISTSEGPPGVYRVHISAADVGSRVALRRVLDDGREGLGDVLGELLSWSAGTLVVRTADGAEVGVEERHLLAGRLIPPRPVRRTATP